MIGQVAALRRAICTMAALHDDVGERQRRAARGRRPAAADDPAQGGAVRRRHRRDRRAASRARPTRRRFWRNIVPAQDRDHRGAAERWRRRRRTTTRRDRATPATRRRRNWGGFLTDVAVRPAGATASRRVARRDRAGAAARARGRAARAAATPATPSARSTASATVGGLRRRGRHRPVGAYGFRALFPQLRRRRCRTSSTATCRALTEDSFPGVLANVIAGRIANRLDLGGVNYTVDAACASSLAALDLAVQGARAPAPATWCCAAAPTCTTASTTTCCSRACTRCRRPGSAARSTPTPTASRSARASACVVLKRLADAERDGDRIYAVIKGVAGSSDGKSLGPDRAAPGGPGARARARVRARPGVARARSGWSRRTAPAPSSATAPSSRRSTEVFDAAGRAARAGARSARSSRRSATPSARPAWPGLIKAALALHHGVLPPTAQHEAAQPRPGTGEASPFVFRASARGRGPAGAAGAARQRVRLRRHQLPRVLDGARGGERPAPRHAELAGRAVAVPRPPTRAGRGPALDWSSAAAVGAGPRLRDLARTVARPAAAAGAARHRRRELADLRDAARRRAPATAPTRRRLPCARRRRLTRGTRRVPVPRPGQPAPGMLAELFVAFPRLAAPARLGARSGAQRMFPPAAFTARGPRGAGARRSPTRGSRSPRSASSSLAVAELLALVGVAARHARRPQLRRARRAARWPARSTSGELLALSAARGELHPRRRGRRPGRDGRGRAPDADAVAQRSSLGLRRGRLANRNAPGADRASPAPPRRSSWRAATRLRPRASTAAPAAGGVRVPQPGGRRRAATPLRGRARRRCRRRAAHPGVVERRPRRRIPATPTRPRAARRAGRAPVRFAERDRGDVRGRRAHLRRGRARAGAHAAGRQDPRRPAAPGRPPGDASGEGALRGPGPRCSPRSRPRGSRSTPRRCSRRAARLPMDLEAPAVPAPTAWWVERARARGRRRASCPPTRCGCSTRPWRWAGVRARGSGWWPSTCGRCASMLEAQRDVLLSYLGRRADPAGGVPPCEVVAAAVVAAVARPVRAIDPPSSCSPSSASAPATPGRDARPRPRPRGGPQHRLDQAHRDPRELAERLGRRRGPRRRSRSRWSRSWPALKTLRGILGWLEAAPAGAPAGQHLRASPSRRRSVGGGRGRPATMRFVPELRPAVDPPAARPRFAGVGVDRRVGRVRAAGDAVREAVNGGGATVGRRRREAAAGRWCIGRGRARGRASCSRIADQRPQRARSPA